MRFPNNEVRKVSKSFVTNQEDFQSCVDLDQKSYIDELQEAAIGKKKKKNYKGAQLTTGEAWQLRGLTGQLYWTPSQKRPDMSFRTCEISTSIKAKKISDLIHANKNIRKLEAERIALQFPDLGRIEECMIFCYSGASFANLRNTSSQLGYLLFFYEEEKSFTPILEI